MSSRTVKTERPATIKRRLTRFAVILAIVLAALATLGALAKMPPRKQDIPTSEVPPVNVTVLTIAAVPQLPDAFDLPAVVEPNQIVSVSAEVAGQVEWIGPKEGAAVRVGDLLLRLNTDLLRAESERAQAQAKYDQSEFDRKKGLVAGGAAPDRDLDEAAMKLAVSRAQLEEVRARLARARIAAPFAGVLNDLAVEQGEYVQPGTRVADIVDTAVVKVVVDLPERDVAFFTVGQKTQVLTDLTAQPKLLEGTIKFISELADPRTRSTRAELRLLNPEGVLRSGQIVRVHLTRRVLENAIMIPLLAVIPMEDSKTVYLVESGKVQRREVELGIIQGDNIQVTRGLQSGDQLIVSGHRFVAPGQLVNIVTSNGSQSK